MNIGDTGLALIKKWEGFSAEAYLDSVGIPTIGYGTIRLPNGTRVTLGMTCTKEEAEEWLEHHINNKVTPCITETVKVALTQPEIDAIYSFIYNLGCANFKSSTLLKKINSEDFEGASLEFSKWNRAGRKVIAGLTARRQDEAKLFIS